MGRRKRMGRIAERDGTISRESAYLIVQTLEA
jgi:hypothetical protein